MISRVDMGNLQMICLVQRFRTPDHLSFMNFIKMKFSAKEVE